LKSCRPNRSRLIGFAAFTRPGLFPCPARLLHVRPSAGALPPRFHPSVPRLLFRVPSLQLPPAPFRAGLTARVSFPLATSPGRVHPPRGDPISPLRSVHRFSQPLDGFLRAPACGLVSSRSHVQGCLPFRGFSPRAAPLPHRKRLPPCRWRPPALQACARRPRTARAGFEALLRAGPRGRRFGD